jgi:hypothetical protein
MLLTIGVFNVVSTSKLLYCVAIARSTTLITSNEAGSIVIFSN